MSWKTVKIAVAWVVIFSLGISLSPCLGDPGNEKQEIQQDNPDDEAWLDEENGDWLAGEEDFVADPLEPLNRIFFQFNDKLYFWLLKPVARLHSYVFPADVRICMRNFFQNLLAPVRIFNALVQGKIKGSGIELARFAINSTAGVAGLGDPAKKEFGLEAREEDFGQTLGRYGMGEGLYINWPVLGPSNVRDTLGLAGDTFLDPVSYLANLNAAVGVYGARRINQTSLALGDYETFKETSLDPYAAIRDAYHQYRRGKVLDLSRRQKDSFYSVP